MEQWLGSGFGNGGLEEGERRDGGQRPTFATQPGSYFGERKGVGGYDERVDWFTYLLGFPERVHQL